MKWWKKAVIYPLLVSSLAVLGCQNPENNPASSGTPQTPTTQPKNELATNTRVPTQNQLSEIISINNNSMTVSDSPDYFSGEIVDIDSCSQAPYGGLVKVTSVSGNTVHTTPATIEEAVKNVSYSTDFSIGTNSSNSSRDLSATINVPFNNVVVYDVDGNRSTTYDEVVANGGFFLNLDGYFKIDMKNFHLNDFILRGSGHDRLELKLDSEVSDPNFSVKDVIATYNKLPAVRILLPTVPPFPIIIKTDLDAFAGAKGSMNVENGAELDEESYFDLGMAYNGTKWAPIKSFTKSFRLVPPSVNSLNLKIYAGADANFLLYGSAGVYLGPDAYLKFISESSSLNIYKGLEAMLGVDVKFLGKTLADYNTQIPIYEKLVSSTPINNGGGNSGGGSDGNSGGSGGTPVSGYKLLFVSGSDVVSGSSGYSQIYTINSDGTGIHNLTNFQALFRNFMPRESPDGKKIAFVNKSNNYGQDIYIMNSDGSGMEDITNVSGDDYYPSWSPDGKIFYSREDNSAYLYNGIWEMNPDGSNKHRLTDIPLISYGPSVSPDGKEIAYSSIDDNGNWGLYLADLKGDSVSSKHLVAPGGDCISWSPDSAQIVFESNKDGNYEIYRANSDGSGLTNLTKNSALDAQPSWSEDGKKIAFISDREQYHNIYLMNPDGSNVQKVQTIGNSTNIYPTFFYSQN